MSEFEVSDLAKEARVLVATPNYTNLFSSEVHTNHIQCSVDWTKWGIHFNHTIIGRSFVHFARSQMVDLALKGDWTHILWLDDDALLDSTALPRMIDHQKDVVIAPYPMRRPSYEIGVLTSTAYKCNNCDWYGYIIYDYGNDQVVQLDQVDDFDLDESGPIGCPPREEECSCPKCNSTDLWRDFHNHKAYKNLSVFHNLDRGLVEVDGGGTHAMLVDCKVFTKRGAEGGPDAMPSEVQDIIAHLRENLDDAGKEKYAHYLGDLPDETMTFQEEDAGGKPYFLMPKRGTEDMYWCYRARRKGVKIFCDTDIFAAHVGFPPVITRGFRQQIEKKGYHKKADKQYGAPTAAVEFVDGGNVELQESEVTDGGLPIRKSGVHKDRAAGLV